MQPVVYVALHRGEDGRVTGVSARPAHLAEHAGRRFRNDLIALGDETPHDDRYARTVEYALLMRRLLESDQPVTFAGRFYRVRGVRLAPALPAELQPGWLISGSSPAGRAAAAAMGAIAVEYPAPPDAAARDVDDVPAGRGIRVGIIARANADEAWDIAHARFPDDRRGRLSHALAMKTSDSAWHRTLSELARARPERWQPLLALAFRAASDILPLPGWRFRDRSDRDRALSRTRAPQFHPGHSGRCRRPGDGRDSLPHGASADRAAGGEVRA